MTDVTPPRRGLRFDAAMGQVQAAGVTVRYHESGPAEGEPIVFLHGLLVGASLWRKVTPLLAGEYRCIAPELPLGAHTIPAGPGADLTPPGLARLVAELLAVLDLRGVTLVGCDTGGAIAQLVATRHPERVGRLVLLPCDCFDRFFPPLFKPLQLAAKAPPLLLAAVQPLRLRAARRLPVAFGWLTKRPVEPREVEDAWVAPFFSDAAIRRDTIAVLRGVDARHTLEAAEALGGFDKPALVAWATEDRVFPLAYGERLAARIPGARLELIDDSYTFVSEDRPERTADVIADFLRATPRG